MEVRRLEGGEAIKRQVRRPVRDIRPHKLRSKPLLPGTPVLADNLPLALAETLRLSNYRDFLRRLPDGVRRDSRARLPRNGRGVAPAVRGEKAEYEINEVTHLFLYLDFRGPLVSIFTAQPKTILPRAAAKTRVIVSLALPSSYPANSWLSHDRLNPHSGAFKCSLCVTGRR